MKNILIFFVLVSVSGLLVAGQGKSQAILENDELKFVFDPSSGSYDVISKQDLKVRISKAVFGLGEDSWGVNSSMPCFTHKWKTETISDILGKGRKMTVISSCEGGRFPDMIFEFTVYNDKSFLIVNGGVSNSPYDFRLKRIVCLQGTAMKGFIINENYHVLDGNGGGVPTMVRDDKNLKSRNNILATFGGKSGIHSVVLGGITYNEYEKDAEVTNMGDSLILRLWSEDTHGRFIDKGSSYLPDDKCYVDVITSDPFESLEKYAFTMKAAQDIKLSYYTFPSLCLWYSGMAEYGGGERNNDSPGAVMEMEHIAKSGFLKYSTAAVRLVPDNYGINNQQGWWDDEHWQKIPNMASYVGPCYKPPYETSRKWAQAVTKLGGIPLIYSQTARRSEDFCYQFPHYCLFNDRMKNYDFTDTGFVSHMVKVYDNLREAGVRGLMFDYPDEQGWAPDGGFDDKYSTTNAAYRKIFRLAGEGLGPGCWIHERNLARGSDVTLGLVASHRTFGDNDRMNPTMITMCGLRWYKNRVVISYDTDAKNPMHMIPEGKDGINAMLTMTYVTTGRLLLGLSFSKMDKEMIYALSRVFPYHTKPQSARPVDAFTGRKYPRIFDFKVNSSWHQLTLYNTSSKAEFTGDWQKIREESAAMLLPDTVSVDLSGVNFFGGLELAADKEYYFYDFWNRKFIGRIRGNGRLEQALRPGEARMISVHEVEKYPQFISTDRHLMQGFVDMAKYPEWNVKERKLSGVSKVIGDETYRVIIALNGYIISGADAPGAKASVKVTDEKNGLAELAIDITENREVEWSVYFKD